MLVPAPYEVPVKKAKKKATGTRKGLRRKVISDSSSENTKAHSPPPAGGEKKRKVALSGEAGGSKKGKTLPPDYSTDTDGGEEWKSRAKPLAKS